MWTLWRRLLLGLSVLTLLGVGASAAVADDEGEEKAEEKVEETPAVAPAEAAQAKLSEEQLDYVAISGTVACYNKRVAEAAKATAAIEVYLETEGLTLDEYKQLEKKFRGDALVQAAIKSEMDLCDTKVLAMPETIEKEEALSEAETKALEEAVKKKLWTYSGKRYKNNAINSGGVSGGRLMFNIQKNGKKASGNFGGKHGGQSFSVGFSGTLSGNTLTMTGGSGSKNSATVKVTFTKKKAKDKDGVEYEHYRDGSGTFSGTINGRAVSFSFNVSADK